MESKVKALKVADLKDALTKAGAAFAPKANKAELVTKVLASPEALAALGLAGSTAAPAAVEENDDLLAPPAEFDWDGGEDKSSAPAAAPAPAPTPAVAAAPKAAPAPAVSATPAATPAQPTVPDSSSVDAELEKRKKRAERFGVALVEPTTPATPTPAAANTGSKKAAGKAQQQPAKGQPQLQRNNSAKRAGKPAAAAKVVQAKPAPTAEETANRNARAARFGVPVAEPVAGKKRTAAQAAAPAAPVDPEEEERRKKRAARFGSGTAQPTTAS